MAAPNQKATALLTEHFRYTPLTLLDDIINTVNELIFRAVNAIEEGLADIDPSHLGFALSKSQLSTNKTENARREALLSLKTDEIDNGIVKLESLLNATVDRDFDKFEIYTLRNILAVGHDEEHLADWVRLDHYSGVDAASAEGVPTPEEVQLQRRKLHETAKLNAMLKAEEAKNAAVLAQLSGLVGAETPLQPTHLSADTASAAPFAFLHQARQMPQLSQDAQYALTQLPALQQLLAQLKEAMLRIPSTRHLRHEGEDSVEGRRRRYLSTQSRRALERRGVDPDASAGAALSSGRKVNRDEMEGIEAVAHSLERAAER